MAICQRCHEYWSLYHSNKDCEIVELRALNAELLAALGAVWAERVNIGLGKPIWTPFLTERIRAVIAKTKGGTDAS